ncbi:hypothetical protein V2S66_31245 [Streptomyces sp. V4-01]|uniref:Uncharacterized protein n=1 Tax=Actinacidiphila polyblastidii TaxID=3110430 RepID=A0ABU7PMZ5_9ACTN|nr:hypothetical protein [Streptomyces sp. V4-01]
MPPGATHTKCSVCGHPLPETNSRARCRKCLDARRPSDRRRRHDLAAAIFPLAARRRLLALITAGVNFPDACNDLSITQARARGYGAFDEQWVQDLDDALMAGRDPNLNHGTINAYRWGACRCPECRQARSALG